MKKTWSLLLLFWLPLAQLGAQTTPSTTGTVSPTTTATPGAATEATPQAAAAAPAASAQQGAGKPDLSVPTDKKDKWVVGFCSFDAERVPPEDRYLSYSVPLLLKNQLAGLTTHTFSADERDMLRKVIVRHELDSVDQSITGFFKERDAVLFNTPPPIDAALAAVDAKISLAIARRDFLRTLDLTRITVADQKPLEVKTGTGVGNLLDPPSIPVSIYCARQGIDLLVGGMVREIEGYVLLDIWAWDATSGAMALSHRDAVLRDEIYQAVPPVGRNLTSVLIGRPWATLSFAPDPPGSSLFVDGKLVATGRTPVLYLSPGAHEILISAPGYRDLAKSITLDPQGDSSVTATLQKEKTGTVMISSTPPGADVYVESVWKGKTPLTLEKSFDRSRVDIAQNGFYDQYFSFSESSPPELSFVLQPDTISRDEVQKKAREDFYNSFAWFAVSLPIPLFCYAFALDAAVQVQQLAAAGDVSAARSAQLRGNLLYGGYLVGTVVSASLFTWMLFRIIHYVSVSTRTAG